MGPLVYDELIRGNDAVSKWTKSHYKDKLINIESPKIINCYKKVMNYVKTSTRWSNTGASQWDDPRKADPWLIAVAYFKGWTIVTLDGGNKITPPPINTKSNQEPKINAVANYFNVNTIPMYELIIKLGIKWEE